jgi:hypothetical protein
LDKLSLPVATAAEVIDRHWEKKNKIKKGTQKPAFLSQR